jgi:DNA-binding transcriptional ArsR family regulator
MPDSRTSTQRVALYRRSSPARISPPESGCVTALKALGEDTRMRIVGLLMETPLEVGEIAKRAAVSQYNVSKHLRILREAGLLQVEKSGRRHLYALVEGIRRQAAEGSVLDLGCCSFRFEPPPVPRPSRPRRRHA